MQIKKVLACKSLGQRLNFSVAVGDHVWVRRRLRVARQKKCIALPPRLTFGLLVKSCRLLGLLYLLTHLIELRKAFSKFHRQFI